MSSVLKSLCLGTVAVILLAAPAALAFTIENKDASGDGSGFASGPYAAPKFDIQEQARQFSKSGSGTATPGKTDFSTPLGSGSVYYGVQQGSAFGSGGTGFGPAVGSRANRADFERMVTPDNLR